MKEKDYWIAFSVFPGIGPVTFQKLLQRFTTAERAWKASENDLSVVLQEKKTKSFLSFRESFDIKNYVQKLTTAQVDIITLIDREYPSSLKQTKNPPFILYVKGNRTLLQEKNIIAIVGSRKVTHYGEDVTTLFTKELAVAGCTIISGLALGVDAIAHQTTIEYGGKPIAVLGCGVDCCYPVENQKLYNQILVHDGLIISEIPLSHSASIGTFPARNRIVAGLSRGILVTEGAHDSGALITAEFGITYNRVVFAVPGPITSQLSQGPYKLIEKGARLVTNPKDILEYFQIGTTGEKEKVKGETEEEQIIIDLLQNEPIHFDEIVRITKKESSYIASLLSIMEVKGLVISIGNGAFSLPL